MLDFRTSEIDWKVKKFYRHLDIVCGTPVITGLFPNSISMFSKSQEDSVQAETSIYQLFVWAV